MKKFLIAGFVAFFICVTLSAQTLPPNFEYKRETGQETGVPLFSLMPLDLAMAVDAMRGSTFEALGMLTQPERGKYGLIFVNAKPEFQLGRQKEKGVLLRIDGEEFRIPSYTILSGKQIGGLKLESAGIEINQIIFDKLVSADDVFIRVGAVAYSLDEDNIMALHYYGAQIERDLERRRKKQRD